MGIKTPTIGLMSLSPIIWKQKGSLDPGTHEKVQLFFFKSIFFHPPNFHRLHTWILPGAASSRGGGALEISVGSNIVKIKVHPAYLRDLEIWKSPTAKKKRNTKKYSMIFLVLSQRLLGVRCVNLI